MHSRRDHRKKPWKNVKSFSKAIKNIFSHLISFPLSPLKSLDDEPKSFYCPIRSRYECPCSYHSHQREEKWQRLEGLSQQHHHKTAEKVQLHGEENDATFQYKDDQENGSSLNDACADLVKSLQQVNDAVSDVDKRAEEFIKQFREQLRNSKFSCEN